MALVEGQGTGHSGKNTNQQNHWLGSQNKNINWTVGHLSVTLATTIGRILKEAKWTWRGTHSFPLPTQGQCPPTLCCPWKSQGKCFQLQPAARRLVSRNT